MKKLVKTAKQQFEERLELYGLTSEWNKQGKCGCIGKDLGEKDGIVIFVHEAENDGYSDYWYPSFNTLRDDADFCQNCLRGFSHESDEFILSIVRWITYDCCINPFDPVDVYFTASKESGDDFEDIYEEVPDVRIITAKEQWETDSKEANTLWENNDETLKVLITDEYVKFYRLDDAITCYTYPSLEKMRKDRWFVCQIVDTLAESCERDKISPFIKWTKSGGDFPLPISIIFNSDYQEYTCHVYEDKELPQEQVIDKKDFSTEITDIRTRMIVHIKELYEQGMTLNSDSFLENAYSITWEDGSYYACENLVSCKLSKSDEGVLCFSETQTNDKDVTYDSPLSTLTINTLWSIINAMR